MFKLNDSDWLIHTILKISLKRPATVPEMGLEPIRLRTRPSNVRVYQFRHPRKYLFAVIEGRRDKASEQRVGHIRLGLEFRMKLAADKPRMVFDLDDFHQIPLGIKPRDHEPFLR